MGDAIGAGGTEMDGVMARVTGAAEVAEGVLRDEERRRRDVAFVEEAGRVLEEQLAAAVNVPEPAKERLGRELEPRRWMGDGERGIEAYAERVAAAFEAEAACLEQVREEVRWEADRGNGGDGGSGSFALGTTAAPRMTTARRSVGRRGLVRGCGTVHVVVEESERRRLVAQLSMDRLLGVEGGVGDEDLEWRRGRELGLVSGLPRWQGIREAYERLAGGVGVRETVPAPGNWTGASGWVSAAGWDGGSGWRGAAQWAVGGVVREADEVTTGVLNYALLNSLTKRLVKEYRGRPQPWRKFCVVSKLSNFKSQDRVKLHDFSSLPAVAEGAPYQKVAWGNARETYTPAKRGNIVAVSREAIMADDLGAILQIPRRLARAAYVTLNEQVFGLLTGNPTMADTTKVFDDGVQTSHGNRGTGALSAAAVEAGVAAMMKQTNSAGKRLGLKPRYLLVPPDLHFTAKAICESERRAGTNTNDANGLRGLLEPVMVPQLTDPTDWYLVCDPRESETIEVGFVEGREEPELLMQDGTMGGSGAEVAFSQDVIRFKVRWGFGAGWIDHRGAYWGQVAG